MELGHRYSLWTLSSTLSSRNLTTLGPEDVCYTMFSILNCNWNIGVKVQPLNCLHKNFIEQ